MACIIALHACRRGTGCSHLAVNLASLLAAQGYRVGLLDTDPRGGGVRLILGLEVQGGTSGQDHPYWWLYPPRPGGIALRPTLGTHTVPPGDITGGIYLPLVIQSSEGLGGYLRRLQHYYGVTSASQALLTLQRTLQLDCLLIDTQPTLDDDNLLALALADQVFLLLQLNTYDFQRIAVTTEVLKQLHSGADMGTGLVPSGLIPSQVWLTGEERSLQARLTAVYGLPIVGMLPFSRSIVQLASTGVFHLHYPADPLSEAMMAVAAHVGTVLPRREVNSVTALGRGARLRSKPVFGLLDLPLAHRQLLMTILRQGSVTTADIEAQCRESPGAITAALAALVAQGWLVADGNCFRYRTPSGTSHPDQP